MSDYAMFIQKRKDKETEMSKLSLKESIDDRLDNSTSYYRHPGFEKAINEHFDITDDHTRKVLLNINEADQAQVLTALTSRLYDNIVDKVDDIDWGLIPESKGDVTKLPNYEKLVDSIDILQQILVEYKQDPSPIVDVEKALDNIRVRANMFTKAYKYNIELPIIMYNTMTLAVISATSLMIASCIEFIKQPGQDGYAIVLDKVAFSKTKENLLYTNLKKFNDSCKSGDFDKGMEYIISGKVKNFTGAAFGAVGTIAAMTIILNIIPIIRELVFFFFYSRTKTSDYFEAQADILQMNAYNYMNNDNGVDPEEKAKIVKRQMDIVGLFRRISDKLSIDSKRAEKETAKDIEGSDKKQKIDDVVDSVPDSASSALF